MAERMTGAQAVIASLEKEGVDLIFGYPGGQVLALYDALYDNENICHILARHEQAAVHEADGFARATGDVGVVLVTSGPGATNTVTGIATAYMDSVPLVIITGQVPRSVIGTDSFQESDIFGITMPIVKHSYLVKAASDLPRIIHEAFHIAKTGRPGPVLIDIPSDVAAEELDFDYPETVSIPGYKPTVRGHARQLKQAVALLSQAKRPVIYLGGGVISAGASGQVRALAERYGIPVVHTLMGIGAVPTDHELNIGMVGMHGSVAARRTINGADVVLACGARFSDRVIGDAETFAAEAKIIHIDIDPAEIGKIRTADVPIVGDLRAVLDELLAGLEKNGAELDTSAWVAQTAAWRKEFPLGVTRTGEKDGVSPAAVLEFLNRRLDPERSIVTTEVGQHQMWAAQFLRRREPRSFLTSGGLGTMGFGLPAAIGAQYGRPDCMVICIAGDGSFVMNVQEMATAAVYGVPIKVVLFNNRCLGMVHQWQKTFNEGRYSQTELENCPDFMKLAFAFGWTARRASTNAALYSCMDELFASKGPFLLEVVVSRDMDVLPFSVGGRDVGAGDGEGESGGDGSAGTSGAAGAARLQMEDTATLVQDLVDRVEKPELWE